MYIEGPVNKCKKENRIKIEVVFPSLMLMMITRYKSGERHRERKEPIRLGTEFG